MPRISHSNTDSQRQQAYAHLRRLLILQQLKPGERLREPEWAGRLGVHRSALREAFARLEAEALIERGPQTGYFVPSLTRQDIDEIVRLRLALECVAIDEICAEHADLQAIAQACQEFAQFVEGGYSLGTVEADRRFHERIVEAAAMKRLSALYARAPLPLIHSAAEDQEKWLEACTRTLSEHHQILDALKQRDAEQAKTLLRMHLTHRPVLPLAH